MAMISRRDGRSPIESASLARRRAALATACAALAMAAAPARAARAARAGASPAPRLVVPFAPSGPTEMVGTLPATRAQRGMQAASRSSLSDVVARVLARILEGEIGGALPVERIPGAGGLRAAAAVSADGRAPGSLLLVSEAVCVHAAAADPQLAAVLDRLLPVAICLRVPYLLVTRTPGTAPVARLPPDAAGAAAAASPRPAAFPVSGCTLASAGYGGRSAVLARAVAVGAGADCRELAFNGGAAALQGLLAGQADAAVLPRALVGPWLEAGTLEAAPLSLPLPEAEALRDGWFALMASSGWAAAGVARLLHSLREGLGDPAQAAFLQRLGLAAALQPGSALAERIARERGALASLASGKKSGTPQARPNEGDNREEGGVCCSG